MIALMHHRSTLATRRFTCMLILVLAAGCALALTTHKLQSLQQLQRYHAVISTNLLAIQTDTSALSQQTEAFKSMLRADDTRQSDGLRLYNRVDQIRVTLKPLELQVTPVETKDGASSVGITLKLPLAAYDAAINAMGTLQTGTVPLVVFHSASFNSTPGTDFTVEGTVLLPKLPGEQP